MTPLVFLTLLFPFQGTSTQPPAQSSEGAFSFVMECRSTYLDSLGNRSPRFYSEDNLFKNYGATEGIREHSFAFIKKEAALTGSKLPASILRVLGVPPAGETKSSESVTWFGATEKGYLRVVRDPEGAYRWHTEWRRLADGTGIAYTWSGENAPPRKTSIALSSWKNPDARPGTFAYPDPSLVRVLKAFQEGRRHPDWIRWFPSARRAELSFRSEEYRENHFLPSLDFHVLFGLLRWDARIVLEQTGSEWQADLELRTRDGKLLQRTHWGGMREGLPFREYTFWCAWPGTSEPYLYIKTVVSALSPEAVAPMLEYPSLVGRMVTDHRTDTAIEYPWPKEIPSAAWVAQKALARGR